MYSPAYVSGSVGGDISEGVTGDTGDYGATGEGGAGEDGATGEGITSEGIISGDNVDGEGGDTGESGEDGANGEGGDTGDSGSTGAGCTEPPTKAPPTTPESSKVTWQSLEPQWRRFNFDILPKVSPHRDTLLGHI